MARNPSITLSLVARLVVLAASMGCKTTGTTATLEETPSGEYTQYIYAPNKILWTKLSIESLAIRNAGDLKQVQFVLHNRWYWKQDFQYKVVWYDPDGFAIDPDSRPWNPVVLRGKDSHPVQATAPRSSATTFKVHVKD